MDRKTTVKIGAWELGQLMNVLRAVSKPGEIPAWVPGAAQACHTDLIMGAARCADCGALAELECQGECGDVYRGDADREDFHSDG